MRIALISIFLTVAQLVCAQSISRTGVGILSAEYGKEEVQSAPLEINADLFNKQQVNNIWSIDKSGKIVSYLFDISIKGRAHTFSSLVLIGVDGSVLQVRITSYPSTNGVQIANKRWLNKLRIDADTEYKYGGNVDTVSGATFSANSMINAIEGLRKGVRALNK
jgi:Na+-translocating ferredoxin:NAD+ oxidoreductase RnfG subunit